MEGVLNTHNPAPLNDFPALPLQGQKSAFPGVFFETI